VRRFRPTSSTFPSLATFATTIPASHASRSSASALDFATGWDDGKLDHGRPADITFAPDGRMFMAQDNGPAQVQGLGIIVWFAPLDLPKP